MPFPFDTAEIAALAAQHNLPADVLAERLTKLSWDMFLALAAPPDVTASIEFIGLDGKARYTVAWTDEYVTARQIIERYRPDLLLAYDKSNPTGEYSPYTGGGD